MLEKQVEFGAFDIDLFLEEREQDDCRRAVILHAPEIPELFGERTSRDDQGILQVEPEIGSGKVNHCFASFAAPFIGIAAMFW